MIPRKACEYATGKVNAIHAMLGKTDGGGLEGEEFFP
jgi:hypothetical protein